MTAGIISKIKNGQRLAANFTVTSTTPANVGLGFQIAANEVFTAEFNLSGQCSGNAGSKFLITIPAGATIEGGAWGTTSGATAFQAVRINAGATATAAFWTVATTPSSVHIKICVINGSTAGSVQLQAESGNASQTTTIFLGSYMTARPVS